MVVVAAAAVFFVFVFRLGHVVGLGLSMLTSSPSTQTG